MSVIAIIAILIAIAIPVFTTQLERAGEATDAANARAGYAEVMMDYIANPTTSAEKTFKLQQGQADWQNSDIYDGLKNLAVSEGTNDLKVTVGEHVTVGADKQVKVAYNPSAKTIAITFGE